MRGGKAALIQKMHHTITDGERGVELSLQYLDFERDAPEPPPVDPDTAERSEVPQPTPAETIRELLAGTMRIPIGIAKQVRELLADPAAIPDASAAAAKTMRESQKIIDRVVSKGILHRNAADRHKSRLAHALKGMK